MWSVLQKTPFWLLNLYYIILLLPLLYIILIYYYLYYIIILLIYYYIYYIIILLIYYIIILLIYYYIYYIIILLLILLYMLYNYYNYIYYNYIYHIIIYGVCDSPTTVLQLSTFPLKQIAHNCPHMHMHLHNSAHCPHLLLVLEMPHPTTAWEHTWWDSVLATAGTAMAESQKPPRSTLTVWVSHAGEVWRRTPLGWWSSTTEITIITIIIIIISTNKQ